MTSTDEDPDSTPGAAGGAGAAGGRRREVLDAAVTVLGTGGARALTYQAVDRAAGVPSGTTSNCFRNRKALVSGVVAHLEALDRRDWEALQSRPRPGTAAELADALAQLVLTASTAPGSIRTVARHALFIESAARPELREPLARSRVSLITWGADWLRHLGSGEPETHCRMLFDYLDGQIIHRIAAPTPEDAEADPSPALRTLLTALLAT